MERQAGAGAELTAIADGVAIRPARPDDAPALAALKLATFRETFVDGFAIPYPPDDRAAFERAAYHPATVAIELTDPDRASWIALRDGVAVGYAQIGPCKLPHPDVGPRDGELYQLYVTRAAQGGGLGRALFARALEELGRRWPGPVWLGVWSGNGPAQVFYRAHGFRKVGDYLFPVGQWRDEEFIFRRD